MASALNNSTNRVGGRRKYLRPASPRRGGFSLIEVVIALGIFVFGALAIIRIFPGSLSVIQGSEQRAVGQRMAQTSLERYTSAPLSVPEAITEVHPNNLNNDTNETGSSDFAGAAYGTTIRNESLPRNPAAPDDISFDNLTTVSTPLTASAASRFRRVIGEEHAVEEQYINGTRQGVITLRYPYLQPVPNPANFASVRVAAVHQPLLFETTVINGVVIDDANGALDFTDATSARDGSSLSDNTDPKRPIGSLRRTRPPIPTREQYTFYVSYRWRNAAGRINAVVDEPHRFPANAGPDGNSWTVGSRTPAQVLLSRLAIPGVTIVQGPVQVKVRGTVVQPTPTQTEVDRNLGRIILDAAFIGRRLSADYTVPDWRMVVHDDSLSTKLSPNDTEFLRDLNYTFAPDAAPTVTSGRQTVVPTRFLSEDPVSNNATLTSRPSQVYALLRGIDATNQIVSATAEWSPDKFAADADNMQQVGTSTYGPLAARVKTGQLFFDVENLRTPSARVVYRNVDGWLQQPSVAARFYKPYFYHLSLPSNEVGFWPREFWREYVWNNNANGTNTSGGDDALYFHPSEAGKSVLATYTYEFGGVQHTMRDVPLVVQEEIVQQPDATVFGVFRGFALQPNGGGPLSTAPAQAARAYFVDREGRCIGSAAAGDSNVTPSPAGTQVVSVLSIKGASVSVRSAWFESNRYIQAAANGYRSLDVESTTRS
jgi:type II secretory pathway pseudopilin PulG